MSAAAASTRRSALGTRGRVALRRRPAHDGEPGRATLDDRIAALWQRLVATGRGECPVCGDEVAAARPCGACGSELS